MNKHLFSARQNIIYSIAFCFSILSICAPQASAEDIYVQPTGAYATIDTSRDIRLMKVLTEGSPEQKASTVKSVLQSPTKFSPGVLFALSAALSEQGNKDESMFWFLVADLRARYDAQRCADDSARSGIPALRQNFGPFIYPYMRQNADKLENTIPKVLAWDASHSYDYDHRWINLHGLVAFAALSNTNTKNQAELSLPKSEWPSIRNKVRSDFGTEYKNTITVLRGKSIKASTPQIKKVDLELLTACRTGDLQAAEDALKHGANPKLQPTGYSPLNSAATAGNLAICTLLVSKGADVNASSQGITPLLCAARYCHPDVIEFLLKSKANPKVRNSDGLTPIMTLLNNFNRSDAAVMKMKTTASDKDALTAIKMLLAAGVDPNIGATYFGTPLVLASSKSDCTEIVRILLDGGAQVNESETGFTPLHAAAFAGNLETVKLLVSRGANVNARNSAKQTPLALAKKRTSEEIQKYLIEHGAKE
jgi:ankyrin repeat protein